MIDYCYFIRVICGVKAYFLRAIFDPFMLPPEPKDGKRGAGILKMCCSTRADF